LVDRPVKRLWIWDWIWDCDWDGSDTERVTGISLLRPRSNVFCRWRNQSVSSPDPRSHKTTMTTSEVFGTYPFSLRLDVLAQTVPRVDDDQAGDDPQLWDPSEINRQLVYRDQIERVR
jgi:hypothetical protein